MSKQLYAFHALILAQFSRKSIKFATFFNNLLEMGYVIMPLNKGRYYFYVETSMRSYIAQRQGFPSASGSDARWLNLDQELGKPQ